METTSRVREILSWYPSDNPGTLANLYRLLMHGRLAGTGKLVILPVDQGFEHGPARSFAPNPPGYDPEYHVQLAIDSGCNAYAAPLGFIEAVGGKYAGQIPLIFATPTQSLPFIRDKKLKALGITSAQRLELLPDVPTLAESGIPGYEANVWFGIIAPAGRRISTRAIIAAPSTTTVPPSGSTRKTPAFTTTAALRTTSLDRSIRPCRGMGCLGWRARAAGRRRTHRRRAAICWE